MTAGVVVSEGAEPRQQLQQFLANDRRPLAKPPTHVTNDVSDIAGARPILKEYAYTHKPNLYDAHDIAGSTSKQLHPKHRNVGHEERFQQGPIEGSWPQPSGFKTDRVCNPLEPQYKLPSFTAAPPIVPKFLRDSYDVSDIDGTKFKKKVVENPRDALKLSDIPGSQAGYLTRFKQLVHDHPPRNSIDVQDIINVGFKSTRVTNVLNPVYTVNGVTSQDDEHSRPAVLHPARKNKPFFSLLSDDIAGANPHDAAKNVVGGIRNEQRRHFRVSNRTDDITGAHADTLLHSIRSNRRTNPNDPDYKALDGTKVDSSAVSVAKSIVFAGLINEFDAKWLAAEADDNDKPYVVSSLSNIGCTGSGNDKKPKRKVSSVALPGGSGANSARTAANKGSSKLLVDAAARATTGDSNGSARQTPAEKKQAAQRNEEIRLVRELS